MTRARTLTTIGFALVGTIAAIATFLARRPGADAESAMNGADRSSAMGHPNSLVTGTTGSPAPSPAGRVVTILDPNVKSALLIRDRLSGRPLADTKITSFENKPFGVTDSNGILALTRNDIDLMSAEICASIEWENHTDRVQLDSGRQKCGILVESTVAATARLEVRVTPSALASRVMAEAFQLPPLPPEDVCAATRPWAERAQIQELASLRRALIPERYLRDLGRSLYEDSKVTAFDSQPNTNCLLFELPCGGDWVVDLFAGFDMRARETAHVERGEVKSIDVALAPRAVISGTLVDRFGSPIPQHIVQVYVSSNATNCRPLFGDSRHKSVILDEAGKLTFRTETRTDVKGRFHFELPFTDQVTLFAYFLPSEGAPSAGEIRRQLGSPMDSMDGLELVLALAPRRIRMQLANSDGTPKPCGTAHILQVNPRDGFAGGLRFTIPVEENGWCDLSLASLATDDIYLSATFDDKSMSGVHSLRPGDPALVDGGVLRLR